VRRGRARRTTDRGKSVAAQTTQVLVNVQTAEDASGGSVADIEKAHRPIEPRRQTGEALVGRPPTRASETNF
jgi:hypothetical protein